MVVWIFVFSITQLWKHSSRCSTVYVSVLCNHVQQGVCACVCVHVRPHVAPISEVRKLLIKTRQQSLMYRVLRRNSWPVTQGTTVLYRKCCRACVCVCVCRWHRPAKVCEITPSYTHTHTHTQTNSYIGRWMKRYERAKQSEESTTCAGSQPLTARYWLNIWITLSAGINFSMSSEHF